ncbi:isoprenyl transferase [Candidatus Halobeggiatoa sp. HSG11]|nr:isoprenyl transferase [Candidatus Halobeggiatoa sp. HSG11]
MSDSHVPRHIAIIMDGNGRWAKKRALPRFAGHKAGVETVRRVVKLCIEYKVEALTLFAFSSENWRRPEQEVNLLMQLLMTALEKEVKKLHENNIRLQMIGAIEAFPKKLQQLVVKAEQLTENNTALTVTVAVNYGGHWDIVEAAKNIASQVEQGKLQVQDIDEKLFAEYVCLAKLPTPDLFIRTGGEKRVSNFLLWQLAYAEMYFADISWPEFDKTEFLTALQSFATRQRRFGRTSEQVEKCSNNV